MAYKNKRVQFCFSLLVLLVFVGVGSALGQEQSGSESFLGAKYRFSLEKPGLNEANLQPQPWLTDDKDMSTDDSYQGILLAQEKAQEGEEAKEGEEKPLSPECAEFAKNPDADVGDVIRAGCKPTLAQMSALMDNPLGNVAMLFTQIDFSVLENPLFGKEANKVNYMGIAQFPKGLGENWNIINRVIWNVPSMPVDQDKIDLAKDRASRLVSSGPGEVVLPPVGSPIPPVDLFDGRTTGFGDMYYNGLFAPKKGYKTENGANLLWGLGFDLGFPTASDDVLGTGKWLAGPSGLGVYMGPKWKVGALVQQYWDYAGDDDRDDVSLMNFQYFIFYSLDEVTSIGAAPNIIANWELDSDNRWTVPIGLGISRTFQFGKVPVRFGLEVHYSVVQPDTTVGAKWNVRFYVIPAAPSALFKWMK
jgi:hypothetical protein